MDNPDYVVEEDVLPSWVTEFMHDGGTRSFRIRQRGSLSGIQVVLDENDNIIPPGQPGTGSPDIFSPTNLPLTVYHGLFDALPWGVSLGANFLSSLLSD